MTWHPLNVLAHKLTREYFGNALRVGRYFAYRRDGEKKTRPRPILVTSGEFLVEGRLSNFWNWRYMRPDGSLSTKESGGYGGGLEFFQPITRKKAVALAKKSKNLAKSRR